MGSLRVEPVDATPSTKINGKWRDQVAEVGEIAGRPVRLVSGSIEARHYIFLTHPGEVTHAMLEFFRAS